MTGQPRRLLGDIIAEKQAEKQSAGITVSDAKMSN